VNPLRPHAAPPRSDQLKSKELPTMTMEIPGLWQTLIGLRERRAARSALCQMNDVMLKDIGITRSEIEAALHGRIQRPPNPRRRMTMLGIMLAGSMAAFTIPGGTGEAGEPRVSWRMAGLSATNAGRQKALMTMRSWLLKEGRQFAWQCAADCVRQHRRH
jgi:uncharacterized protein YjiS (DUF1127 family)